MTEHQNSFPFSEQDYDVYYIFHLGQGRMEVILRNKKTNTKWKGELRIQ